MGAIILWRSLKIRGRWDNNNKKAGILVVNMSIHSFWCSSVRFYPALKITIAISAYRSPGKSVSVIFAEEVLINPLNSRFIEESSKFFIHSNCQTV